MNRLLSFGKVSDIRLGKEPAFDAWFYSFCAENNIEHSINPTGVAGPDPDERGNPVGLVYLALAAPDGTTVKRTRSGGVRERIRTLAASGALDLVRRWLSGAPLEETGTEPSE